MLEIAASDRSDHVEAEFRVVHRSLDLRSTRHPRSAQRICIVEEYVALPLDMIREVVAAARKSMGAEAAAEFENNCRQTYDQMARIAIVPSWVRDYDFGAGRISRFLTELAERKRS